MHGMRCLRHTRQPQHAANLQRKALQRCIVVAKAAQGSGPPTVADTKQKFLQAYRKPVPGVYTTIVQELLVQQHLMRYNKSYQYDEVFALGFVSVFDQVLDGLPSASQEQVFAAYINALDEDPARYRADAEKVEGWAKALSGAADLKPDASGGELQQLLAGIAERAAANNFLYTKFFAIGLFRLLELTGAKDPKALEALVRSMNVPLESVNRDLMTYKGVLSKLGAAKEMMRELVARERKKAAEREAEKKAKQDAELAAAKAESADVQA
ncbi:hypothetical protein WJX72_000536 [[Myrmecia] bisecta]|uniref:Uncharacterized protein n=1 Tax=[Myrmecia] bisecta TaxID=41462 RepID=A0AAW1QPH4_9CHLO